MPSRSSTPSSRRKSQGADPEDPDEYRSLNVFWVPPEARWAHLRRRPSSPTIGKVIDDAMAAIERDNPSLKGVLPKDYARPALDKTRLGELIDLISDIGSSDEESAPRTCSVGSTSTSSSQFASAEGKNGGEFYTPRSVVKLLVEMLEPYKGRVYDPCCGSGGMFVQSSEFIGEHAGRQRRRRHLDLRPGVELHHLAPRQDEPRDPRHRRQHRLEQRGHVQRRPPPRPQGRLHPRQSAVQHLRLGRRAPARGRALEVRRAAGGQRQLRLGAAHHPPPGARGCRRVRAGQRLDVIEAVRRGRHPHAP